MTTPWLLVPAIRRGRLLAALVGLVLCLAAIVESSSISPLYPAAVLGAVVLGLSPAVAHRLPLVGLAMLWFTPLITFDPNHPVRLGGTQLVALMILVGYASFRLPFRAGLLAFALSSLLPALSTVLLGQTWWEFLFYPLIMAPPWVVGLLLQRERRRSAELARMGRQLAEERELRTTMALAAERARIAQELHDAVAHTVSVMTLQVGVVRRRLPEGPEHETLAAAERLGRQSVTELRRIVGLVRPQGTDPMAPLPSVRNVEALAADVRAAGTTIVTDLHALPELPPALDTAAYRVVQEAVTNALRHAPGRAITVMITVQASELLVQVSNASSGPPGPRPELRPGTGITGMQERVRTFGGTFAVEDADEDFVVRATFPLPAESQLPAERQLPAGPEPALTATPAAEHRPG